MKPSGMSWLKYFRLGFGRRLTQIGELYHIDWLIYNPFHFFHFHDLALEDAPGVIRALNAIFPEAVRYADIGSGSGAFAAEAQRQGKEVICCEHSFWGRMLARWQKVQCLSFDLNQLPPAKLIGPFNLAYCFEVAEHLPEDLGVRLVKFVAKQAPLVVFTAAQPGQGGTGHINERPKSYWIEKFHECQMIYCDDLTQALVLHFQAQQVHSPWFANNAMVFTSNSMQGQLFRSSNQTGE